MSYGIWLDMINDAVWLLLLCVVYEISYQCGRRSGMLGRIVAGILTAGLCIAVMSMPYQIDEGIIFDTRSVLLCVTALVFGFLPAVIASGASIVYRMILGGSGTVAGIAIIITSAAIGLVWRKMKYFGRGHTHWPSLYLMGILVHLAVLVDILLLPGSSWLMVLAEVAPPMLVIFPIACVVISLLLINQQSRNQYQKELQVSESKYRNIMENMTDGVWVADLDMKLTYVSQSTHRLTGGSGPWLLGRTLEENFTPESAQRLRESFQRELEAEKDPASPRDRSWVVEVEQYRSDCTTMWLSMHISFLRDRAGKPIGFQGVTRDITRRKRSELALEAERERAQLYIELAPVVFIALDRDLRITLINTNGSNLIGKPKEEILGREISAFVPQPERKDAVALLRSVLGRQACASLEAPLMTTSGVRKLAWRITVLCDGKDAPGVLLSGMDVTDQLAALDALRESERSKRVLLENLPGMSYRCRYDRDWTMEFVSRGCQELTGYKDEDLLYNRRLTFNSLILPEYREYLWKCWCEVVKSHGRLEEEYEIRTADGKIKWVWEQGQPIYDEKGNVLCLEGLILDITSWKLHEQKLRYLSEHDPLSGLYNMRYFESFFLKRRERRGEKSAAVMINVRRFSAINSVFGYRYGDNLIRDVAETLLRFSGEDRLLFHVSIDRFLFYIVNYADKGELVDFCHNVVQALDLGANRRLISFGVGIMEIREEGQESAESILKRVSMAAEQSSGGHEWFSYSFFDEALEEGQRRQLAIRQALTESVHKEKDEGLFMLFQPVIGLKSERIFGFEALARFNHPILGPVSPMEFIPIAESSQLIMQLGRKFLKIVLQFAKRLRDEGYQDVVVSLNISAIQLLNKTFISELSEMVTQSGVSPCCLNLEVTESVFSDNYLEINSKLEEIQALGMSVAMDDFGTGYSSLAREGELNINYLKIDKYFIDRLLKVSPENSITSDIISMAHKLGHVVIAEGVEEESQKRYLTENGCDLMQGFLFSRPVDEDTAISLLKKDGR